MEDAIAPLQAQLTEAVAGLTFPSEGEAGWQLAVWSGQLPGAEQLRERLNLDPAAPMTAVTPEEFWRGLERRCRGYGPEGKAMLQRYRQLLDLCQGNLQPFQIWRIGTVTVTVVLLGQGRDGGAIALWTESVET